MSPETVVKPPPDATNRKDSMKVITPAASEFKRLTCNTCKAVLEIDIADVKIGYFGANYGGETPDKEQYVECPECGNNVILPWEQRFAWKLVERSK